MQNFQRAGKNECRILAISCQKFMNFWNVVKNRSTVFGSPIFRGGRYAKNLFVVFYCRPIPDNINSRWAAEQRWCRQIPSEWNVIKTVRKRLWKLYFLPVHFGPQTTNIIAAVLQCLCCKLCIVLLWPASHWTPARQRLLYKLPLAVWDHCDELSLAGHQYHCRYCEAQNFDWFGRVAMQLTAAFPSWFSFCTLHQ